MAIAIVEYRILAGLVEYRRRPLRIQMGNAGVDANIWYPRRVEIFRHPSFADAGDCAKEP
jgi:hypothetical protein